MNKKLIVIIGIFGLLFLIQANGFDFSSKYLGEKTKLVYISQTSPATVEVREVYLRSRNYDLLESPSIIGYYFSYRRAAELPVESVRFIRSTKKFPSITVIFDNLNDFSVVLDSGFLIKYRDGNWQAIDSVRP